MKLSLRVRGATADKELTEQVRNRAAVALGRFSDRVNSVVVRLDDMNGPKGGIDKRCTVEVTGSFGQRLSEARDQSFGVAVDRAFAVVQRSVVRAVKRRELEYRALR
jgi:putative sigma-54 modulation protein